MIKLILILGFFALVCFAFYLAYKEAKLANQEREARLQTYEIISKVLPEIQVDLQNFVCEYVKPKD